MSDTTHPMSTRTWSVDIFIGERDGHTHARAHLHTADQTSLEGTGYARLNPADRDVPQIGDEIAVGRALSELSHRLLDAAGSDIEDVVHAPYSEAPAH